MNKKLMTCLMIATTLVAVGCKAKQSNYRKAYESARQREIAAQNSGAYSNNVDVAPQEDVKPAVSYTPSVRREKLSSVEGENGSDLNRYSVVIGSFQNLTNAKSLKERMIALGYKAVLAQNDMGMYRVIVSSFSTKNEAAQSRDAIKAHFAPEFSDAWLLENEN